MKILIKYLGVPLFFLSLGSGLTLWYSSKLYINEKGGVTVVAKLIQATKNPSQIPSLLFRGDECNK